jgi:hypothetical protein
MPVPKVRTERRLEPVMHARLHFAAGVQTVCRQQRHGGRVTDDHSIVDCAVCKYILNKPMVKRPPQYASRKFRLIHAIEQLIQERRSKSDENNHS